jgi:hypothetical protein
MNRYKVEKLVRMAIADMVIDMQGNFQGRVPANIFIDRAVEEIMEGIDKWSALAEPHSKKPSVALCSDSTNEG